MRKQTLNEEISRIQGMIRRINEYEFDDFDTQIAPEELEYNGDESFERAQEIASQVLSDFSNREIGQYSIFDDESFSEGEVFVSMGDEDGNILDYYFDVDMYSRPSHTPGRSHMPSGEPGYPDEYTEANYTLKPIKVKVEDRSGEVMYEGNDFTDIMTLRLSNGETFESMLYKKFDEYVDTLDSGDDERDWDDYRDMRDGY